MELELENAEDGGAVETLFDLCFGGSRAMLSSYRLRAGVDAVASLCFVLREGAGAGVVGAIRYWPVNIVAGRVESVAVGRGVCGFRERGVGIIAGTRRRTPNPSRRRPRRSPHPPQFGRGTVARLDAGYFDRRCQLLRAVRVRPRRFGLPTAD